MILGLETMKNYWYTSSASYNLDKRKKNWVEYITSYGSFKQRIKLLKKIKIVAS